MLSTHAQIEAVIRFPNDPLSASEAGLCLGWSSTTIGAACRSGDLTANATNCKPRSTSRGNVKRYRITKANLIHWIWKNEQGDKTMLRAAMQDLCPKILKVIEASERPATARPKAANIIAFEHPDLFDPQPRSIAS